MQPIVCYKDPGYLSVAIASVLIVGTAVSYILQIVSIARQKSSEGLSYLTLTLGLASGLLLVVNTLVLKWQAIVCCSNLGVTDCLKNNLIPQTIVTAPVCLFVVWLYFLYYFNYKTTETQTRQQKILQFKIALLCFGGTLSVFILLGTIAVVLYYGRISTGTTVASYAEFLGVASAVLTFVQWCPQIAATWRASSGGSLSLPMLLLQAPGAYLVVILTLLAPDKPSWTTWLPYAVGGTTQVLLITMLIVFIVRDRIKRGSAETKPLFSSTPNQEPEAVESYMSLKDDGDHLLKFKSPISERSETN